jgi:hypothetical protein
MRNVEWESFQNATERRILRAICYTIVFILIAFLAFINLVFGVKFSPSQTNSWLLSIATGVFTGQSRT